MSTTKDYILKMENTLLTQFEPGQVWLTRSPRSLHEPAFILLGPRPARGRFSESPYDVIRTRFRFGQLAVMPDGGFFEPDVTSIGEFFQKLRELGEMRPGHWTRNLFIEDGKPLFYEKLFSFSPWE